MILARNGKKNGCPKMEERERKERVPFPFLSCSHFFPFLAWHISSNEAVNDITKASWGAILMGGFGFTMLVCFLAMDH